jgi:hypothetical protein
MLAVLAAFFCLLFFAAAKKSRCRPAQGRRMNGRHRNADASEKANAQGRRMNGRHRNADASKNHKQTKPSAPQSQTAECQSKGKKPAKAPAVLTYSLAWKAH